MAFVVRTFQEFFIVASPNVPPMYHKHTDCQYQVLSGHWCGNINSAMGLWYLKQIKCRRASTVVHCGFVTNNQIRLRGAFFAVSAVVLAIMWLIYIVEILTSPWV
jgi:hypothetical protein